MPKQLNVDLRFNADTSQAKKQIQDLQTSLSQLGQNVNISKSFGGINSELTSALSTVNTLKTQLDRAFNTQTGKLDLTKFTQEMERSGMSLEKYQQSLMKLGPEGSKAFAQLANSIASADIPLMRTNKLLNEMGTVLKNTIKWQLSSSLIHGFMGAVQQAYGYAQDLNESLTNIRIVTGQSTDQMAAFAAQANKAAQALSTTTTAYTDAALIFYQQGLSDSEVEERTNAVIKMSQATGDAATDVSSYMTAVWNNFDNGADSLEHYADVITALGAATASSSSEIAQGLEKFASIADTVGLSYEYATTALATVVAQTRQSADVVGTAFKTMFARFQDLELGKTLEDGTDLGQYSKALEKVGVDIKDANGELRDMDDILDDLGAKWATLADDEKVALAQNVAGQRQYAQLVALMDNWDTFQENLITANSAEGTLQKQADIYAESWEAAQKRVKASMEGIYQSIIDDKFFIKANNFLADNLNGINNLIKALGGLPGVLSTIGVLLTRYFNVQIANSMRDMAASAMMFTKAGREKVQSQQSKAINLAREQFEKGSVEDQTYGAELEVRREYLENAEKLNELENDIALTNLKQVEALRQKVIASAELQKLREQELQEEIASQRLTIQSIPNIDKDTQSNLSRLRMEYQDDMANVYKVLGKASKQEYSQFTETVEKLRQGTITLRQAKEEAIALGEKLNLTGDKAKQFNEALNSNRKVDFAEKITKALDQIEVNLRDGRGKLTEYKEALIEAFDAGGVEDAGKKATQMMNNLENGVNKVHVAAHQTEQDMDKFKGSVKSTSEVINQAQGNTKDWASNLVMFGNGMMQVSMAISNIKGIFDVWNNQDMSFGEKLLSTLTSLGMVIPIIANGFKSLSAAQLLSAASTEALTIAEGDDILVSEALGKQKQLLNLANALGITETEGLTVAQLKEAVSAKIAEVGTLGFTKALLGAAAAELAALWPLALIAAAIAALVVSYKLLDEAYNADAIAAQKAQENAQKLAETYQESSDKFNELKNTISNYQQARDGLDELTKGTQEFKDALFEANEYARQLIETANLTPDQYSWENGLLTIDDNVLQQAQETMQRQVFTSQAAMLSAQNQASDLQNRSLNTDIARQVGSDQWRDMSRPVAQTVGIVTPGTFLNGLVASEWGDEIVEGIGNLEGKISSYVLAPFNSEISSRIEEQPFGTRLIYGDIQEQLENLAEDYQEFGIEALHDSDLFNNATSEMQDSIIQYCENMERATEVTRLHNQEIAHSVLNSEQYSDNIINLAAESYDSIYQGIYDEVMSQSNEFSKADTEEAEGAAEFFARYIQAAGLDNSIQLEGIEGVDTNRRYTYYEDGELKTVTAEQVAATIAASEAVNGLAESAEEASNFLSNISNDTQHQFFDELFGNTRDNNVAYEEFLENYIGTNQTVELNDFIEELGISEEEYLEALDIAGVHIKTIDAANEDFVEAQNNLLESFNNYIADQTEATQKFYQNQDFSELNYSQSRSIVDAYSLTEENGANRIFEEITSHMAPEAMAEFAETLEGVDWSSINSREFLQLLSNSGFEVEGFEDILKEFCSSMRTVTAETLAASAEFFNGLQKIADGLSDQSDEISAEDFTSLPEDMQQFFALTIDGTYKLLGAARDFQEYVEQSRIQEAIDNRNALYSQYDEARRGMSATDVGKMQESGYAQGAASDEYAQYLAADMAIALHYDDLNELQRAYAEGTVATIEAFNTAAYQIDQAQDTAMLDQETWQEYSDYIREAGSALEGFNDEMDDLEADIVAKSIMKMNQAVETLSSNFDEWRDVLENSTEASAEYADALIGTRKAIAMLLDISEDYVSSDFVTEHLDLIAQAAEGDAEAIDQLRVELSQDVGSMLASAVSSTEADAAKIESWLNELTAQALAFDDLEVGASLYLDGKDGFVEALNEMIAATGMTVDQVNALCDSMGFEANFASEGQRIPTTIPEYTTHHEIVNQKPQKVGDQEATT